MPPPGRRTLLAAAGAAFLADTPAHAAQCAPAAVLRLDDVDGCLVLPGAVEGRPTSLLLDTGAATSLVTPDLAAALRLPIDPTRHTLMQGTGGNGAVSPNVLLPSLRLGTLTVTGLSVPVGALPSFPRLDPPVGGLLGIDLLARFDAEISLPSHRLALYPADAACTPPGWQAADTIPLLQTTQDQRPAIEINLDGHPLTALVDSGARSIILAHAAALALGVPQATLDADPGGLTSGVDLRETPYHWHRFTRLRIGAETLARPVLTVSTLDEQAQMLLGAPWFATRTIFLSLASRRMLVRPPTTDRVGRPPG